MTLSIVLGSTLSGVVRAGEIVFGAIPLGRERDWEKGCLTAGKAWRLRMIRQSPECCKPRPCVVLGSTDPTPSLGKHLMSSSPAELCSVLSGDPGQPRSHLSQSLTGPHFCPSVTTWWVLARLADVHPWPRPSLPNLGSSTKKGDSANEQDFPQMRTRV